uniref:Uncharacterized protein n=1 Tax=Lepeophtheirus salmonis TaxID=72036 RepID=A0A0K2U9Y7_LEPSM
MKSNILHGKKYISKTRNLLKLTHGGCHFVKKLSFTPPRSKNVLGYAVYKGRGSTTVMFLYKNSIPNNDALIFNLKPFRI